MAKKALILQGGWDGHDPKRVSERFRGILCENGFDAIIANSFECFSDKQALCDYDLIVPCWNYTGGADILPDQYAVNVADAVSAGVGLAGCHGGMNDAFRENVIWQFMTGAQWVAHPSKPFYHCSLCVDPPPEAFFFEYEVNITDHESPLTKGIPDFKVISEQYYLHVDPSVRVLATTTFSCKQGEYAPHLAWGDVTMPVVYTRQWGKGKIYYNSIGHDDDLFTQSPEALELMRRGLLWAAR